MVMGNCPMKNTGMLFRSQELSKIIIIHDYLLTIALFSITEEEFQEIMKIKDTDGDGTISIKEFLNTNPTKNKKSDLAFKLLDK